METVVQRYLEAAQRLFGPLGKDDGLPASTLAAAEQRLRVALPRILREVYLASGQREDLHASRDRLLLPDELALEDRMLVFYEQAERAHLWALRLAELQQADPPVWGAHNAEPLAWEPDSERLSSFLDAMLLAQRMGRGPWVMKRKVGAALLEKFQGLYPPLPVSGRLGKGTRWFGQDGHLVRVEGAAPAAVVTVAAPTGDALRGLGEALDIVWTDAEWEAVPSGL